MAADRVMRGGSVTGWGLALPDKTITNADLEARLDTTDAWITERTGIKERRVGGTTVSLAVEAGRAAIARAGLVAGDIDQVILATTTPDMAIPQSAAEVQDQLGICGGACDLNAACSGFVYALVHAYGLLALGVERVLLIGSETLSRIIDCDDRNTAVLFADGAGAVVLESGDEPTSLLGFDLGSDGSAKHLISAEHEGFIRMEGRELFRRAVRVIVDSAEKTMAQAGVNADDLALFVPHQANIRIIEAAAHRLGIPMERTHNVLSWTGNTSAASIPLALADAADAGRLEDGDLVLLSGFGAGMSWASAVVRWGKGA